MLEKTNNMAETTNLNDGFLQLLWFLVFFSSFGINNKRKRIKNGREDLGPFDIFVVAGIPRKLCFDSALSALVFVYLNQVYAAFN